LEGAAQLPLLPRNPPIAIGKIQPGASARIELHDITGMHEIEELEQRFRTTAIIESISSRWARSAACGFARCRQIAEVQNATRSGPFGRVSAPRRTSNRRRLTDIV